MLITPARFFLALACGSLLAGCAHNSNTASNDSSTAQAAEQMIPKTRMVVGAIGYRERIALPPGSVAQVKLLDVSQADAPATVLAEQTTRLVGSQVPVPFELKVEPRMFDSRMTYTVSGQIRSAEGQLLWTTDTRYPIDLAQEVNDMGVLTMVKVSGRVPQNSQVVDVSAMLPLKAQGNEPGWTLQIDSERMSLTRQGSSAVQLTPTPTATRQGRALRFDAAAEHQMLVEVTPALCHDSMTGMPYPYSVKVQTGSDELSGCGGEPAALLTGKTWQVQSINGEAAMSESVATISFSEDGKLGGQGACNAFTTGYELTGEGLSTRMIASTQRACFGGRMEQDQKMFDVLQHLSRFDIDEQGLLQLITADGRMVVAKAQ
ncbi:MAG: YbaY family lipoprotein [Pseudomonadaceae bacterium]